MFGGVDKRQKLVVEGTEVDDGEVGENVGAKNFFTRGKWYGGGGRRLGLFVSES